MQSKLADIRRELVELKHQVGINEKIWARFRHIEIDAIGARTLHELVYKVTLGIEQAFDRVDCASIGCIDVDYEIGYILNQNQAEHDIAQRFVTLSTEELRELFPVNMRPILGQPSNETQRRLFPACRANRGSIALSPLVATGQLIGCLAQSSQHPHHFSADTGTELLEHLSATIALCIRNTVNMVRLERHGLTDPLTDIPNRRFFERRLIEEVERCRRYTHPLTCVMLDIDHFKKVNDQYGHSVGDRVLRAVANVLREGLRASDMLARYGGEEFVLLLPETSLEQGKCIARRNNRQIEALRFTLPDGQRLAITASAGVAVLETPSPATENDLGHWLLQRSDQALYQAKRHGRNQVMPL